MWNTLFAPLETISFATGVGLFSEVLRQFWRRESDAALFPYRPPFMSLGKQLLCRDENYRVLQGRMSGCLAPCCA